MNKLKQMEIMSDRIKERCRRRPSCINCPLVDNSVHWCFNFENDDEESYKELKQHCEILKIDISDIVDEPKERKIMNNEFTKNDIEPGYVLQLKDDRYVIAMGEKRNLLFYNFDVKTMIVDGYAFCLDDIRDDFTIFNYQVITTVYGHTFSKTLDLGDRLILWERKGNECKIYNIETDKQSIKIQPNANTYLSNDRDGDIYIDNLSDADESITIHRENLSGVITALQEIQKLYERKKD